MKIKNIIVLSVAACGLMFTSCTNDDLNVNEGKVETRAISFDSYMSRNLPGTKAGVAGEIDLGKLKESNVGFGVFASYHKGAGWDELGNSENSKKYKKPNFMYNQQVTWDGTNAWEYSPIKYWPQASVDNEWLSFFAYAPYVDESTQLGTTGITAFTANKAIGEIGLTYVPSTEAGKGVDLLVASPVINLGATTDPTTKIQFTFLHALSQIAFKVKSSINGTDGNAASETKVYVESIAISANLYNEGKVLISKCGTTSQIAWDYTDCGNNFTLNTEAKNLNTAIISTGAGVTKDPVALLKGNNNSFIVMPTKQDSNNKVDKKTTFTVNVTYHVVTTDDALNVGASDITNTIKKTIDIKLDPSTKYTLTMNLGLKTVVFDKPTVENWTDETGGEMKLPEITK